MNQEILFSSKIETVGNFIHKNQKVIIQIVRVCLSISIKRMNQQKVDDKI